MQHLESRHCFPARHGYSIGLNQEEQVVCFLMHDFDGRLAGYQEYRPNAEKLRENEQRGRYYTYVKRNPAVFGMETLHRYKKPFVFLNEGIFDAVRWHNFECPSLALMSNDPKYMRQQLELLPQRKVAVVQGDAAGLKLAKYGDYVLTLPIGRDAGDLSEKEVAAYVKEVENFYG